MCTNVSTSSSTMNCTDDFSFNLSIYLFILSLYGTYLFVFMMPYTLSIVFLFSVYLHLAKGLLRETSIQPNTGILTFLRNVD